MRNETSLSLQLTMMLLLAGLAGATPTMSSVTSNFNGTGIAGGDTIWFNSVFKLTGTAPSTPFDIYVTNATITFSNSGNSYNVSLPNSKIHFDNSLAQAATSFTSGSWVTNAPTGLSGNYFLDGFGFSVPAAGLSGGTNPVVMSATFETSAGVPVSLQWQWAAAVYTSFGSLDSIGLKPVDSNSASAYNNSDHAGTPESFKSFVVGGARGGGGSNFTGSYSGTASLTMPPATNVVPEPATYVLMGLGLVSLSLIRRR